MSYQRARRIIDAGIASAPTDRGRWTLQEVEITAAGYAEPGYGSGGDEVIAFGNWNTITRWDYNRRESVVQDRTPERVGNLLERAGIAMEWNDEWTLCCECNRAVRTQADSYSWTRSYVETEYGATCADCTLEDPATYLESLEGNPRSAITLDIDPTEHGYIQLPERFANGLYGGQASDPKRIAETLEAAGIYRYVFRIDSVGQFDCHFSVYVHEDEADEVPDDYADEADGPDPAAMLRQALQSVPKARTGDGIQYTKVDLATGTAETRTVTPEEFIEGIEP